VDNKPDNTLDKRTSHIAAMFNDIAPRYDFLNHFFSTGIDRCWRRKLVGSIAQQNPLTVLDVATGTGDVALLLHKKTHATITAIDISEGMLEIARRKQAKACPAAAISFSCATAEALPFADRSFDAVTVSFGVRNFEHLAQGLREMHRVLKPSGTLAILEFAMPVRCPMKQLYRFYFTRIMPATGRLLSGHRAAYSYLPTSVAAFPQGQAFLQELQQAGFATPRCQSLTGGIAMLYRAKKI
jgi:demethylmenaquinone methyltransferase/2-methoxy-6-polyprenyl-1,4-benzoquinol methylase